ncbi:MAG: DUF4652 domain-containing protein [Desulfitobacterium hafniense]|nr:DUF4652 domain-containing protein [Desulfitobacterium hafniense]
MIFRTYLKKVYIVIGIAGLLFLSLFSSGFSDRVVNLTNLTNQTNQTNSNSASTEILHLEASELALLKDNIREFLETKDNKAKEIVTSLQSGKVFAEFDILGAKRHSDEIHLYLWVLQQGVVKNPQGFNIPSSFSAPVVVKLRGLSPQLTVAAIVRPWEELESSKEVPLAFQSVLYGYPRESKEEQLSQEITKRAKQYFATNTYKLFTTDQNFRLPPIMPNGVVSPDRTKAAYLYPNEWETISDIYLETVSADGAKIWTKLSIDQSVRFNMWNKTGQVLDKYTPKKILWENDNSLLVIVGYAYGTVSPGGDLIRLNVDTGRAEMVYPALEYGNQQVTDMRIIRGQLKLIITTFDSNMTNPKTVSPDQLNPYFPNPNELSPHQPNPFQPSPHQPNPNPNPNPHQEIPLPEAPNLFKNVVKPTPA